MTYEVLTPIQETEQSDPTPPSLPSRRETAAGERIQVRGPFFFAGDLKFTVRGVAYGTFAADDKGDLFPPAEQVRQDFEQMVAANINTVRTYTVPPVRVLEEAARVGLRVLVGIYWGGEACQLDDAETLRQAEQAVRSAIERCRAFPETVLGYLIGNEIRPLIARFHGRRTVERFLRRLFEVAKETDPEALISYGNFPSTEYLQLDFLDFHTFNVFLLDPGTLSAYLDRMLLHAKGKPLLLGEMGDDSLHTSPDDQAELLDWMIPLALNKGLCGVNVFSWTDDWVVGGQVIEDWAFGIVDRERQPKPAYEVVRRRYGQSIEELNDGVWPKISVVVCNHNGAKTLEETLCSLLELDYPDYEIIYVDDGSQDHSLEITQRYSERITIIAQKNGGLSGARNVGARTATGEIVAYIDSDAFADSHWLSYLALTFASGSFVGVGGPNLTPRSDGLMAQFVAACPGNPTFVLKNNVEADHIAGVNMAFRREELLAVGGFDPVHKKAGDDVDICWRLMDAGYRLGFSPAAVVWHHRRPSIWRYLKQQAAYGEAENQLQRNHPERFNLAGFIRWGGRVYTARHSVSWLLQPFIYHGKLGEAMFQTLYQKEPSFILDGPATIHWYLLWVVLFALTPLSLWFLPVALVLLALSAGSALFSGLTTQVPVGLTSRQRYQKIGVITLLNFLHPIVRTYGRIAARILHSGPWHPRAKLCWLAPSLLLREIRYWLQPGKQTVGYWGIQPAQRESFLKQVQREMKRFQIGATFSMEWENHDLQLNGFLTCQGRFYSSPEHHGQALRLGFTPRMTKLSRAALIMSTLVILYLVGGDLRWTPLLALPVLSFIYVMAERACLRTRLWDVVGKVAEHYAAQLYDSSS